MRRRRVTLLVAASCMTLTLFASWGMGQGGAFVPLGEGPVWTYSEYAGVPFAVTWPPILDSWHWGDYGEQLTDALDLRPYRGVGLHVLQKCAWADHVPNGMSGGAFTVWYGDGTSATVELVVGVNTAEWAYDRPEIQPYLQHAKVEPAFSWATSVGSAYVYQGHMFYTYIPLEAKPLDRLELAIYSGPYTDGTYGYSPADWFGIQVEAVTLEQRQTVGIDIKPGSYPNAVNLGSSGVVPVAILSTADFDATTVDPGTIVLGGAVVALRGKGSRYLSHIEDVDGDGDLDLLVQVEAVNLDPNAFRNGMAQLTGETRDGLVVEGWDEITIVPPR